MASLIYWATASLDGYIEDEQGEFGWAEPDEEVHSFANELARPFGTNLYGRRMYETMVYWETEGDDEAVTREFAELWRGTDKVVYSRTLEAVSSKRTRIEREFDAAAVRQMKESAESADRDRRRGAGRTGDRRRPARRDSPPPRTGDRRQRQAGAAGRRAPRPRTARRAPLP